MLSHTNDLLGFGDELYVERDGQYQLEPFKNLTNGDHTHWGQFEGVVSNGQDSYYCFSKTVYDKYLEQYDKKHTFIAVESLVHPTAEIHAGVAVYPGAIVQEDTVLLEGAIVKTGRGVAAGKQFHHLMAEVEDDDDYYRKEEAKRTAPKPIFRSTAAASPKTTASKPNPSQPGGVPDRNYPLQRYLESR